MRKLTILSLSMLTALLVVWWGWGGGWRSRRQSCEWPQRSMRVKAALEGRMRATYRLSCREERANAFNRLVRSVWEVMGRPPVRENKRDLLKDTFMMACDGTLRLADWLSAHEAGGSIGPEALWELQNRYARGYQVLEQWLEQQAQNPTDPAAGLAEAILAETDQVMKAEIGKIKGISLRSPTNAPPAEGTVEPRVPLMRRMLREMVLLYALKSRPRRQLEDRLGALGGTFGLAFDSVDAGCAFAWAGAMDRAKRLVASVVRRRPVSAEDVALRAHIALCFHFGASRATPLALQVLDDMQSLAADEAQMWAALRSAECYEHMKEYARAVLCCRRAAEAHQGTLGAFDAGLRAAALEAFRLGSPDVALQRLHGLTAEAPDDERRRNAWLLMARIYIELQRRDEAVAIYEQLRDREATPEASASVMLRGIRDLYRSGSNEMARKALEHNMDLFERGSKLPEALLCLALVHFVSHGHEEARKHLGALVTSAPAHPIAAQARFLLGHSKVLTQDYGEALKEFEALCTMHAGTSWARTAERRYLSRLRSLAPDGVMGEEAE